MNTMKVNLDKDVCIPCHNGMTPEEMYGIRSAQPCAFMIEKMMAWRVEGFKLVIETDRDVETEFQVTMDWLQYFDIPYDEIVWKP